MSKTPRFPAIVDNRHFAEDGHPLNVRRNAGFIDDAEGIVICGECAVNQAERKNGWRVADPEGQIRRYGILSFDPSEGDDWCSICDKDIVN